VAIDKNGTRLPTFSATANSNGYSALEDWECTLGCVVAFGIEGTGSYGAGLSRHLLVHGHTGGFDHLMIGSVNLAFLGSLLLESIPVIVLGSLLSRQIRDD
jgi:hypothetical protein